MKYHAYPHHKVKNVPLTKITRLTKYTAPNALPMAGDPRPHQQITEAIYAQMMAEKRARNG